MAEPNFPEEPRELSVTPGGPTFQLFRSLHLSGDNLEFLNRRVVVVTLTAWLPLLLLAAVGSLAGGPGLRSFHRDIEVHARFLVALPTLLATEVLVHMRIRPIVRRFVERRIVLPPDIPTFDRAVASAIKLRNSVSVELGLLLLVYIFGPLLTLHRLTVEVPTWYAKPGAPLDLTPAGFWYVFVSVPIIQFLLVRWYMRLVIWFRFLWRVSRLNLHLIPTHPDRCGGLGFLGRSAYAFSPLLFAEGATLSGLMASEILYRGASLLSFKWQVGGAVVFFIFVILGPLSMFTLKMYRAKRRGLADYGLLAQDYVEGFEQKWVLARSGQSEQLLGNPDIQSLADLGNSYAIVRAMNVLPFSMKDVTRLAVATVVPLLPLLLTTFSAEEIFWQIAKMLF
jgi:hypothetical protein